MVTHSKVAAEPLCKTAEDLLPLLAAAVEDDPDEDTEDEDGEDKLETSIEDDSFIPLELCPNVSSERLGEFGTSSQIVF